MPLSRGIFGSTAAFLLFPLASAFVSQQGSFSWVRSSSHYYSALSSQSSSSHDVSVTSSSSSESTWAASAVSAQYQEFEKALAQEQNLILLEEEEDDNDLFMAPGCGDEDEEECSLDDDHEDDDDDMWLFQDSTNTGIHFPSWWISAHMTPECARACAEMLDLVQQADFAEDVQKLAQQQHRRRSQHAATTNHIQHASVVAVGPAGIIVRVVQEESPQQQQPNIQDIPIPFANSANTVASLRQAVLQTVSPARP